MTPETVHKLKRLQTLLAATSYSFPAEDAKGFPNLLPAARKIGLGRRSLTGMMTSGAKVEGPGPFESALERDYFVLLEFDQQVSVWHPQPAEVTGPAAGRSGNQKYYPDVLVERIETVNGEPTQRAELCEIKYREEIFRKWVTLKPKFKACRRYARQRGWRFRILTEVEIRTPRLANAKFLLPYSRRDTDWILEHQVMESVRALGETTIHQYMASLPGSQWDKAAVLPVVYYLICRGEIVANLDQPLTPQSPIRAVDQ